MKMIGGFGDAETFSFHATKFINSFEGGAVVTNDDDSARKMRLMKNFGFSGLDNVIYIGTNGKLNEASAAMGLTSLESLDKFIEVNHHNYLEYCTNLKGIPGLKLRLYDECEKNNFQYIITEVDENKTGISHDLLMKILHAENIRARRYFYPGCHRMEPYRSYYPIAGLLLPETEKISEKILSLPTGTAVQSEEIQKIGQIIRFVIENATELRHKVAARFKGDGRKSR
jgi:dTDP-4-amino-4,6-dideoxygalactose transaminase